MGRRLRSFAAIIVATCAWLLAAWSAAAISIGVAPTSVELADALRGGEYLRTLYITNTGGDPQEYTLQAEGEAAAWLSFLADAESQEPLERLTVPGGGRVSFIVRIRIPEDAASGAYEATLVVRTATAEGSTPTAGGAAVTLQAKVSFKINVTGTQRLTGEVRDITAQPATEVNYPYRVSVYFRNTGNVMAKPVIAIALFRGEQEAQRGQFSETEVKPEEAQVIDAELSTEGLPVGEYLARVTVSLGNTVLATKKLPVELVPFGTLSRSGEIVSMAVDGQPVLGRVAKILVNFKNTGQLEAQAQFLGEVYREGALVATIDSRQLLVTPGEEVVLTSYYKPEEPGSYTIKGQVNYSGKLTDFTELTFQIGEVAAATGSSPAARPLGGFGGLGCASQVGLVGLVLGGAAVRWRKQHSQRR